MMDRPTSSSASSGSLGRYGPLPVRRWGLHGSMTVTPRPAWPPGALPPYFLGQIGCVSATAGGHNGGWRWPRVGQRVCHGYDRPPGPSARPDASLASVPSRGTAGGWVKRGFILPILGHRDVIR